MVHTLPDWTTKYKMVQIFGNIDDGELAARLGALSLFDRRGNLVWFDDFEAAGALKWLKEGLTAYSITLSTAHAWMGNQSVKLVTDNHANDFCYCYKSLALPISHRMGAEIMCQPENDDTLIELRNNAYSGTRVYQGAVQWDVANNLLYYLNSGNTWTALTYLDYFGYNTEHWIPIKLVVDWDLAEYVRILFGGTTIDMSGIKMWNNAAAYRKFIYVYFKNTTTTNTTSTAYFDNFIFTQNEP